MVRLLLFRGDDRDALLRQRAAGDRVVAWDEAAAQVARAAGIAAETLAEAIGAASAEAVEDTAIAWTKDFGQAPLRDGQPLRGLLRHDGLDLWWLFELHVFHATGLPRRVRRIEAFSRLLAAIRPDEVVALGLPAEDHVLLGRTAIARGVFSEAPRRLRADSAARVVWRARLQALKLWAAVAKRALAPAAVPTARGSRRGFGGGGASVRDGAPEGPSVRLRLARAARQGFGGGGASVRDGAPEGPSVRLRLARAARRAFGGGGASVRDGAPEGPSAGLCPARAARRALFLSHAAFWRTRRRDDGSAETCEHYFDRLIPDLAAEPGWDAAVVAVGPRAAFRRRGLRERLVDWIGLAPGGPYVHMNAFTSTRVLRATRPAVRAVWRAWRALRDAPGLADALTHAGVRFGDLCAADIASAFLEQLPWAVRSYEETKEALRAYEPDVLVAYAESSGWGRVAVAAARAAGVPTVAMQHGLLYPHYYSYLHRADEADAPRPDRTAIFGASARRFLIDAGGYPPESLVITGSPRFDALVAQARGRDRDALRARLGVAAEEKLVLVASRYRGIRETHPALGSDFLGLARAIEADPRLRGRVKPHPAESAAPYQRDLAGLSRTTLCPPDADLVMLMAAADVLVTVESLAAFEALVLGLPVVVLRHPTHLRALVEEGVAIGVAPGQDPAPALDRALFDTATREALAAARARYVDSVACGADGQAGRRILELITGSAR